MLSIELEKRMTTAQGPELLSCGTIFTGGRATAVVGPSGAGKTTLLKMIAGLIVPDRGRIESDGTVWYDSGLGIDLPPGRRGIGYVSQEDSLFTHMTVEQNVAYACRDREYREFLLRIAGLGTLRRTYPCRLSGGQKQRVALCRALSRRPKYLLLDEPFSALDRSARLSLQNQVVRLRRLLGFTLLLVSHDRQELERLAEARFSVGRECPWERPAAAGAAGA